MSFKKYLMKEEFEPGRPLFDYIDDLSKALDDYYEYSEEQAEDPEEFEDIGEAIGMIRKSFAMFQSKVEDADKIIQSIIAGSKGLDKD